MKRAFAHAVALALGLACALLVAGAAHASPSLRGSDGRPQDRFYFTVYGGMSTSNVGSVSRASDSQTIGAFQNGASGPSWAAGFGETYWPCDYFGLGFDTEFFNLSFPQPNNLALDFSAYAIRMGPTARVALPLRYLQLYVGVAPSVLGIQMEGSATKQTNADLQGGFGADFNMVYLFGSNFYINRNLRAFVEYRFSMYDGNAINYSGTQEPRTTQRVSYQSEWTHLLVSGIAWSPEAFRSSPNRIKKYIWGFPLVLMATGMISMAIIGHRP